MYLSKSDFKIAQTCPTRLYYKKRGYPSLKDEDEYLSLLAEGGYMVQKIATLLYPEGREMPFYPDPMKASEDTMRALQVKDVTLFEATLIVGHKLARIDILRKRGNEFHLIEVKSTSYDSDENTAAVAQGCPNLFRTKRSQLIVAGWREYLEDVTFQVSLLRELFPDAIVRAFLLMPDKSKTIRINALYSKFRLIRRKVPSSRIEKIEVEFAGDVDELRRQHFLTLVPVDAEVDLLAKEVATKADRYAASLNPLHKIATPLGVNCRKCEYRTLAAVQPDGFRECWGDLAGPKPHLLDLYQVGTIGGRGGPVANRLIHEGKAGLFDIERDHLVNAKGRVGEINRRQLIQLDHTRGGTEWFSDALTEILESFRYPLHFIDFEMTALAIPYHAGMRPYESVAFQWSVHTIQAPDSAFEHSEWINVQNVFPNFEFAETLMSQLGREGTMFMWAPHENTILRSIIRQMQERGYRNPELAGWLRWIVRDHNQRTGRLVDMNRLCLKHYFHPLMKGRTSIKVVCDAIWKSNADLRSDFPEYVLVQGGEIQSPYASLSPLEIGGQLMNVAEGTGAIRAYEAMMYGAGRGDAELRGRWMQLLLHYCKLDTLSMAFVWRHWTRST